MTTNYWAVSTDSSALSHHGVLGRFAYSGWKTAC